MNDRAVMEDLLLLEKGACDLFLHGTMEAGTDNVHQAFHDALNEALCMQDTIYDKMAAKGWYPSESVEQTKVSAVKQKFIAQ